MTVRRLISTGVSILGVVVVFGTAFSISEAGGEPASASGVCRASPLRPTIRDFKSGIGRDPIWGIGLQGPLATAPLMFGRTKLGFRYKVLWLVSSRQRAPITLSIKGRTGAEGWLEIIRAKARTSVVLDPKKPPIPPQTNYVLEFPSTLLFKEPGCYVVTASWPEGRLTARIRAVRGS